MESDNINSFPVVKSVLKKLSAEFIVKFCMVVDHQNVTDTFEHPHKNSRITAKPSKYLTFAP